MSYLGFIWDLYVLGLKTKGFLQKKHSNNQNQLGTHSPKMGVVVWPKIPKMPKKISAQYVCTNPKDWDFRKKLSWCPYSVVAGIGTKFLTKFAQTFKIRQITYGLPCVKGSVNSKIFQKLGCKAISVAIASTLTPAAHRTGHITLVTVISRPTVSVATAISQSCFTQGRSTIS